MRAIAMAEAVQRPGSSLPHNQPVATYLYPVASWHNSHLPFREEKGTKTEFPFPYKQGIF